MYFMYKVVLFCFCLFVLFILFSGLKPLKHYKIIFISTQGIDQKLDIIKK